MFEFLNNISFDYCNKETIYTHRVDSRETLNDEIYIYIYKKKE